MGNCQAAEASALLIQHPNGPSEKFYHPISAKHIMASNPGHYVAIIVTSRPNPKSSGSGAAASPVKYLKLLSPEDTLHVGHIYRLVSFQEVLSKFASKKKVRLSKLIVGCKERSNRRESRGGGDREAESGDSSPPALAAEGDGRENRVETASLLKPTQWRPALQSIAEVEGS